MAMPVSVRCILKCPKALAIKYSTLIEWIYHVQFDSIFLRIFIPEKRVWIVAYTSYRSMLRASCIWNGNGRCSCSTCINMYKWNLYTLWHKITKWANRNRDLFADLHLQIHHRCTDDATNRSHRCHSAQPPATWMCVCKNTCGCT